MGPDLVELLLRFSLLGEGNLEQVNSVGAFYSTCEASPCIKHGKHRTDGDGAEDTTDDDRTETSATSGSRTEDETGSGHKDIDSKTQAVADDSLHLQANSRPSKEAGRCLCSFYVVK